MSNFYNQTAKEVVSQFNTDPKVGLTSQEVSKRQEKYGKNILKVAETPL